MALLTMAVYDTTDNGRTELTKRTIKSIYQTVNLTYHTLVIIDNDSCRETKEALHRFVCNVKQNENVKIITNSENLGTAKAINQGWKLRKPNQHLIKMDNDVVINYDGWVEELEEAIEREPSIGICGLKRKDCIESPFRDDFYKSELVMLPHEPGQKWIIAEYVNHVMGTCQMYNWRLIEKIGGLVQPKEYGFDDVLAAIRCHKAGFKNAFLPHIEIDHIDPGGNAYMEEKSKIASDSWPEYKRLKKGYQSGEISIYQEI